MSAATKPQKLTPAQRAKARRRDAALAAPPPRLRRGVTKVRDLELVVAGRRYPIGRNIDGPTAWEMTAEGAATVTLPVRSPDGSLLRILASETVMQRDGVRCTIDGAVYVVSAVSDDGMGLVTLTCEDEVAWRLRQFTRFLRADRESVTRAGFANMLADEASRRPLAPMRRFIPERLDIQPIDRPVTSGTGSGGGS